MIYLSGTISVDSKLLSCLFLTADCQAPENYAESNHCRWWTCLKAGKGKQLKLSCHWDNVSSTWETTAVDTLWPWSLPMLWSMRLFALWDLQSRDQTLNGYLYMDQYYQMTASRKKPVEDRHLHFFKIFVFLYFFNLNVWILHFCPCK